jgi:Protein of unknown function (DUF3433)
LDSIELEYSSLPPQFVIWKALRRGHPLLAAICGMTLLANVLSVALNGLLFEDTVQSATPGVFDQPHSLHFVALNGSGIPFSSAASVPGFPSVSTNGVTFEPLYVATSNVTAKTPMPPWTDDHYFYLPFLALAKMENSSWSYRAQTPAIGAQANCWEVPTTASLTLEGATPDIPNLQQILSSGNLTISMSSQEDTSFDCVPRIGDSAGAYFTIFGEFLGRGAAEFNVVLDGTSNLTSEQAAYCREHVAAGWIRAMVDQWDSLPEGSDLAHGFNISSFNATIIACRPELVHGIADIIVDDQGLVQKMMSFNASTEPLDSLFTTTPSDLLGQVHQYVIDRGMKWHQDSNPSDFMNYLMAISSNDTSPLDPNAPIPDSTVMTARFEALYSKLFTILLGRNMDILLLNSTSSGQVSGHVLTPETRIFISIPFFIIAQTILSLYIIATIALYALRPWRILARMPDTPASIIAYFAASNAVRGFQGMAGLTKREREKVLKEKNESFGFGSFIGTDGRTHVGIEKHPFLAPLTREESGLSWRSGRESKTDEKGETWWKGLRWRSREVREGGWI